MVDKNLISILENISYLLELKGENPFKARAYTNAAQVIKVEHIDVASAVSDKTLGDIKGFGEALQKKITEYVETGKMSYYEKLVLEVPEGLVDISRISGIGTTKARKIFYDLGITTLDDLENACLEDKLSKIKGFGGKSQESILSGIYHKRASKGKYLQQNAIEEVEKMLKKLSEIPDVMKVEVSGGFRRFSEIITELYFLICTEHPSKVKTLLSKHFSTEVRDDLLIRTHDLGISQIFDVVLPQNFAWRLHETTGNTEYLDYFINLLNDKGFDAYQNFVKDGKKQIIIHDEADIYKLLDIQYVPPELRENSRALGAAINHNIPKLIENYDLKGMLHVHSTWSDGIDSISDMALKSKELGFSYMVICDHSKSAVYANGLTVERVKLQHEEINALNRENLGIYILKGIESDILPDGSLDYPEEILESFDLVVASVHSSFKMSKDDMTRRLIYALMSPYTTMLGHPTGRLLLARPSYEVDIEAVIDAAAEYGKIIEINSNPYRLDLSWENAMYAKEKGVKIAINPDSHETETLSDIFYGVKAARKAWLTSNDVVNCLGAEEFIEKVVKKH